jgi:hypothetical protein
MRLFCYCVFGLLLFLTLLSRNRKKRSQEQAELEKNNIDNWHRAHRSLSSVEGLVFSVVFFPDDNISFNKNRINKSCVTLSNPSFFSRVLLVLIRKKYSGGNNTAPMLSGCFCLWNATNRRSEPKKLMNTTYIMIN